MHDTTKRRGIAPAVLVATACLGAPVVAMGSPSTKAGVATSRAVVAPSILVSSDTIPTAPPTPPTNTGEVPPSGPPDTTAAGRLPPTGAANSRTGTGTGDAALGTGLSGQPSGASGMSGNMLSNIGSDARIVSALDVANTDEISAAMLAREMATSPEVRAFAENMIRDHTRMQTEDRELASNPQFIASDSAEVTRELRRMDNVALAKLHDTPQGPAFDAAYIADQITAHQRVLALLNASKGQAKDDQLRDMISNAIPVVQSHLEQAMKVQESLGKS